MGPERAWKRRGIGDDEKKRGAKECTRGRGDFDRQEAGRTVTLRLSATRSDREIKKRNRETGNVYYGRTTGSRSGRLRARWDTCAEKEKDLGKEPEEGGGRPFLFQRGNEATHLTISTTQYPSIMAASWRRSYPVKDGEAILQEISRSLL